MKTLILSFAIMLSFSANTFAQNRLFRIHRSHCSKQHSIDLVKLKDFKVIAGLTIFRINEKMNIGMFYQMVLESKSKDCLILYPCFDTYSSHYHAAKNMPYGEVKAALNMDSGSDMRIKVADGKFMVQGTPDSDSNEETAKLDTAQYIRIIAEDNMKDYFNADTVFIFKVRLPQPYKESYNECIGINAIKRGYPSAIMKILLTEEGKKKEEEYIQLLFRNIRYPNAAPEED